LWTLFAEAMNSVRLASSGRFNISATKASRLDADPSEDRRTAFRVLRFAALGFRLAAFIS
jgi:hypothetical protein